MLWKTGRMRSALSVAAGVGKSERMVSQEKGQS